MPATRLVIGKQSLDAFVRQDDGSWLCVKNIEFHAAGGGIVAVAKGQRFIAGTVFAGFDDFPAYLESICIENVGASAYISALHR